MKKGKANRNRAAGHNWEREIVNMFNSSPLYPTVGTAREYSVYYDGKKVDIVTKDISQMGDFNLAIQAKTTTVTAPYPKLLKQLRKGKKELGLDAVPVVFHKQTERVGNRFMPRDKYACLFLEDFLAMDKDRRRYKEAYELLNEYFDSIDDKEKPEVNKRLTELGL